MKKLLIVAAITAGMMSCGNAVSEQGTGTDSLGDNPSALEGDTKHPTGVTNQNVISTDTAAMNVERMHDTTGK